MRLSWTCKVAVRPGHPVLLGYAMPRRTSADRPAAPVPVIGVPGYPLAAAVSFELFAVPLLAALQGREPADGAWRRVQLGCDWTSSPHVEEWVPVSLAAPSGPHDSSAVVAMPIKGGAGAISGSPAPMRGGRFSSGRKSSNEGRSSTSSRYHRTSSYRASRSSWPPSSSRRAPASARTGSRISW
jgi:hypothetical protein